MGFEIAAAARIIRMSRKLSIKAHRLFEVFAQSAMHSGFSASKAFFCPLCLREFTDFEESWREKELSIEHVPMKALGARIELLTCSDCNHLFGYRYQPSLETAQILQRMKRGENTKAIKASVETGDRRFSARLKFQQGKGFLIEESTKGSPPENSNYWDRKGPSIALPGLKVRLELPLHQDAAMRSLLRDAYLLMFNSWGCWLLRETWAEEVRRRLVDATTPIPKGAVVQIPFLPFDLDPAFGEFLLVTSPKDLMCYLVPVLDRCVCLPTQGDTRQCIEVWRGFEQVAMTDHTMALDLQPVLVHQSVKTSPIVQVRSVPEESSQYIDHIEVSGTSTAH